MGDAAHATTPNMGQGACQAIEDAFLLASCLSDSPLQAAFYEYIRTLVMEFRN
ncbi:MAG: FAD-dependent monooxygenase [Lewinellaceae bacterium]|nr:FAD-dependent monooxygenase [Lewinellaceae bacterium]